MRILGIILGSLLLFIVIPIFVAKFIVYGLGDPSDD